MYSFSIIFNILGVASSRISHTGCRLAELGASLPNFLQGQSWLGAYHYIHCSGGSSPGHDSAVYLLTFSCDLIASHFIGSLQGIKFSQDWFLLCSIRTSVLLTVPFWYCKWCSADSEQNSSAIVFMAYFDESCSTLNDNLMDMVKRLNTLFIADGDFKKWQ